LAFVALAAFAAVQYVVAEAERERRRPIYREEDWVRIEPRGFCMGSHDLGDPELVACQAPVADLDAQAYEKPQHLVKIGKPFLLSRYEVTFEEYDRFVYATGKRPPSDSGFGAGMTEDHKKRLPVITVSWEDAQAYARWLSEATGKSFRLPTEAEWEYAARGGLVGKQFPWGDEAPSPKRANYAESGLGAATTVGRYPANGYGLYDMAGNVWEYCLDEWKPYSDGPQENPVAGGMLPAEDAFRTVTTRRVIRGGSWGGAPVNLRAAYRDSHPPAGAGPHVGFRCVRPAPAGRP
jgi:formylglycine-generating enzyme required for sulfatase activity